MRKNCFSWDKRKNEDHWKWNEKYLDTSKWLKFSYLEPFKLIWQSLDFSLSTPFYQVGGLQRLTCISWYHSVSLPMLDSHPQSVSYLFNSSVHGENIITKYIVFFQGAKFFLTGLFFFFLNFISYPPWTFHFIVSLGNAPVTVQVELIEKIKFNRI